MDIFNLITEGHITTEEANEHLAKDSLNYSEVFVKLTPTVPHQSASFCDVFRNKNFLVQLFDEGNGIKRLSINRCKLLPCGTMWEDGITWDEIQEIKDGCGFANTCAVEIYPPKIDIVNVANVRHIFLLPEPPAYAWRKTQVTGGQNNDKQ